MDDKVLKASNRLVKQILRKTLKKNLTWERVETKDGLTFYKLKGFDIEIYAMLEENELPDRPVGFRKDNHVKQPLFTRQVSLTFRDVICAQDELGEEASDLQTLFDVIDEQWNKKYLCNVVDYINEAMDEIQKV